MNIHVVAMLVVIQCSYSFAFSHPRLPRPFYIFSRNCYHNCESHDREVLIDDMKSVSMNFKDTCTKNIETRKESCSVRNNPKRLKRTLTVVLMHFLSLIASVDKSYALTVPDLSDGLNSFSFSFNDARISDDMKELDDRSSSSGSSSSDTNIKNSLKNLKIAREPKKKAQILSSEISINIGSPVSKEMNINLAAEKVIVLKAYLDEAERDLFNRNWNQLLVYLCTFSEQDQAFALLINELFPNADPLDESARQGMICCLFFLAIAVSYIIYYTLYNIYSAIIRSKIYI